MQTWILMKKRHLKIDSKEKRAKLNLVKSNFWLNTFTSNTFIIYLFSNYLPQNLNTKHQTFHNQIQTLFISNNPEDTWLHRKEEIHIKSRLHQARLDITNSLISYYNYFLLIIKFENLMSIRTRCKFTCSKIINRNLMK